MLNKLLLYEITKNNLYLYFSLSDVLLLLVIYTKNQ
jgi:hypothetical protein